MARKTCGNGLYKTANGNGTGRICACAEEFLDLYPLNMEDPVRIELFDTEVDSIRTFSAEDQRSTGKLKDDINSSCIRICLDG